MLRCNSGELLHFVLRLERGTISEVRGVEWCASNGWGWPPFIGSMARPRGMGRRRWRHGYGLLAAWVRLAIDGRSPGDALVLECARRGGGNRLGTCGALRGRGGVFDDERWLWGTGRRTGVSRVFLGSWRSGRHGLRSRGGMCTRAGCGAL